MAKRLLSPSAINLFFQCPRRFYYRYIKKLPLKDSIYAVRGTIVHNVLEKIYDIDSNELTNQNYKEVIHNNISQLFKNEWNNSQQKLLSLNLGEDKLNFFYEDSIAQIDTWTNNFLAKLERKLKELFLIKKAWDYYYPKQRELKLISNNLGLIGFADQVLEISDRPVIIDFKTSKDAKISDDYTLQLACYHIMYKEKYNTTPETFLWFLKHGIKKVNITEQILKDTLFKIEQVQSAIESNSILDYNKKQSGLCKWSNANGSGQCDFYDSCVNQTELP